MAMELFQIFGRIGLNGVEEVNGQLSNTTNNAHSASGKMVSAFKKIGTAVATYFAVDKIKNFGKACVDAAADVAAEQAAFEQIMGDYAPEANEKLQSVANATGITSTRMTGYMTSLSAKFKGLGYDVDDATGLAARGLQLAADGSAFWDMSLDESTSHLNSFINGSYEGGEAIGLFANDTQMAMYALEQGIISDTKAWANLDEATKQATRLEYAENMYALSGATGQAAKESGAYLNVQGELTEAWRQFKAAIGTPILENVVIPAMQRLSEILPVITEKITPIAEKFVQFAGNVHEMINEWIVPAIMVFIQQLGVAKTNLQPVIDAVKNFASNLTRGANALDIIRLACKGFETVMEYLGVAVIYVSEKITEFFQWLQTGSAGAEAFKAVIVGITAAFVTYKTIMLATKAAMLTVEIVTKAVAIAQGILNAVMSANPIMLIVIALAALTAAFIYLWNHCEGFRNFWIGLWEDIKVIASNVAEWFKTAWADIVAWFQTAWADISAWFTEAWNSISEWFKVAWEAVSAWFQTAWADISAWFTEAVASATEWFKTAWEDVSTFFQNLWNGIKSFLSTVWDGIVWVIQVAIAAIASILDAAFQIITLPFRFIWENCKEYVYIAWDWISEKITTAVNAIGEFINTAFTAISEFFNTIWNGISNGISVAWDWISEKITTVATAIGNFITTAFTAIKEFAITCWNGISNGISVAWDWISEKVSIAANAVSEFVTNAFNAISEFVTTCWNGIKEAITTAFNAAKDKVVEIANTLKTKITTAFNAVKTFVTNTWNTIKEKMETPIKNAKEFVANAVDSIKTKVSNVFDSVKTKVTNVWNSIKEGIETPIENAKKSVKNAIDKIKGFFNFEFKWPKLKLPHFSFSGSWNPFDWPDQFPKLGVDWYAKGGILNSPTLFGISPSGNAMVGGEAGAEAVAPIDTLMSYVSTAVRNETDNLNYSIQKLISMLSDYMPQIVNSIDRPLVLDTGAIVGGIARNMDGKLGDINRMKGRGN